MEADIKALIELMAKSLVDKSEEVSVAEIDGEKTVRAMRTILSAAGTKLGKRCILEILD
jgi:predicted RNA-binding protein YlqC (UPF0109 family)